MNSPDPDDHPPQNAQPRQTHASSRPHRSSTNVVIAVVAALTVTGGVIAASSLTGDDEAPRGVPVGTAIDGVQEYPDLSQEHVETAVDYPQSPPVGGDHLPVWQNCGFYDAPVQEGAGVHSLEHGAVWVGFDPALPDPEVAVLQELAGTYPYLLVSPVEGVASPVVASAWGVQLELQGVADERLTEFLLTYLEGEQTPEPGAPCTGGLDA